MPSPLCIRENINAVGGKIMEEYPQPLHRDLNDERSIFVVTKRFDSSVARALAPILLPAKLRRHWAIAVADNTGVMTYFSIEDDNGEIKLCTDAFTPVEISQSLGTTRWSNGDITNLVNSWAIEMNTLFPSNGYALMTSNCHFFAQELRYKIDELMAGWAEQARVRRREPSSSMFGTLSRWSGAGSLTPTRERDSSA
ncbi:hypothetical protein BD410DRAFT_840843 [Rickenella mellea]|uniref:PPPDE domain-containing protein n=1 Tax=Rickenella mellea TaxID=50990 RepID=A0A4Y7Q1G9_9AGAM|nr:hypothetical protein BD410DRAFT_840843 [Rickenella mellea]